MSNKKEDKTQHNNVWKLEKDEIPLVLLKGVHFVTDEMIEQIGYEEVRKLSDPDSHIVIISTKDEESFSSAVDSFYKSISVCMNSMGGK